MRDHLRQHAGGTAPGQPRRNCPRGGGRPPLTRPVPLEPAPAADEKQRTVILGEPAAVEAAQESPESACQYAEQALDQLTRTWYATGMDRVLEVRKALQPWAGHDCVQRLDDRLYGWQTTLSTLQH